MKVLMIGPFPPIVNGVTVGNDFLFRWFTEQGVKVSRINTETGKIASRQGDKVSIRKILTFLTMYTDLFRITGKDAVYMTTGQTFWGIAKYLPFMFYCRLLGVPYTLHIHGGYLPEAYSLMSPRKQFIVGFLLNRSRALIALSDLLADNIRKAFPKVNVHVVENFYDPRLVHPEIIRVKSTIPRFLFLSNLMVGKGILEFLNAMIRIQDHYKMDFNVAIAGTVEKGLGPDLNKRIALLGNKVTFFGLADFEQKKELLYSSDIFVLPTWYQMEGQPISIIEAYVTGNVVVSTWQGGIKDISRYDTFFKVEPQQPDKLAEMLCNVSLQLSDLRDQLKVTAHHALNRFDPDLFGTKIGIILSDNKWFKEIKRHSDTTIIKKADGYYTTY